MSERDACVCVAYMYLCVQARINVYTETCARNDLSPRDTLAPRWSASATTDRSSHRQWKSRERARTHVRMYMYVTRERARARARGRRTDSRQTDDRGWFSDETPLVAYSGASLAARDTSRDGTGAKRTVHSHLAGSVTRSAATAAARKCHR